MFLKIVCISCLFYLTLKKYENKNFFIFFMTNSKVDFIFFFNLFITSSHNSLVGEVGVGHRDREEEEDPVVVPMEAALVAALRVGDMAHAVAPGVGDDVHAAILGVMVHLAVVISYFALSLLFHLTLIRSRLFERNN